MTLVPGPDADEWTDPRTGEIIKHANVPPESFGFVPYHDPVAYQDTTRRSRKVEGRMQEQSYKAPEWDAVLHSGIVGRTGPMAPLWQRWQACNLCRLCQGRKQVVLGSGNPENPRYIFVGEGPGANEDQEGTPFVGRTGKVLTQVLDKVGINRVTESYLMNAVCCWPPGNRNPERDEVLACRPRLIEQTTALLATGKVRVIVLVGKPAYAAFMHGRDLERETFKIDTIRIGKQLGWVDEHRLPEGWPRVYTVFHPSYIARQGPSSAERLMWEKDFEAIKYWADLSILLSPRNQQC